MGPNLFPIAFIGLALLLPPAPFQDASATTDHRIDKLIFEGLERCPSTWPDEILELRSGDVVNLVDLKDRSGKLLLSGLFAHVKYKYLIRGSAIDVIFFVEEKPWDMPVEFDNFIWFEDVFLHAAIGRGIPGYDGEVPEWSPEIDRRIMAILDKVLEEAGIAGKAVAGIQWGEPLEALPQKREVVGEPHFERSRPARKTTFSVKASSLSICTIRFVGDSLPLMELEELTRGLQGADYSRSYIRDYVSLTIEPVFRNLGQVDVDTREIIAEPYTGDGCDGVKLSLSIRPGTIYRFDGITWRGDLLFSPEVMESSIKIRKNSVVDESLIREGLDSILESYGAVGYLDPHYSLERRLDRTAGRVIYDIEIEKGDLYYMGTLTLIGLSPHAEEEARAKWKLEAGQVFDSSYPEIFMKHAFRKPWGSNSEYKFTEDDDGRRLVHVTLAPKMKPDI